MIDLYTWTTPNGQKPIIMLEELGAEYALKMVDIGTDEQMSDAYRAISPYGKIPAIVDRDTGQRVFESGAILIYLAEKHGKLLPRSGPDRTEAIAWTFFQAGGTGPMLGQYHHFASADETIPYAIERYRGQSLRALETLDRSLREREYLAGEYSIADVMNYSWAKIGLTALKDDGAADFQCLAAWVGRVGSRPAVARALDKLAAAKKARD